MKKELNELKRLSESIKTAMYYGDDSIILVDNETKSLRYFSRSLMCPISGISYSLPEPNSFSFNSPKGMCKKCKGLGKQFEVNSKKIIPDHSVSIEKGVYSTWRKKNTWGYRQMEVIAKRQFLPLPIQLIKFPEKQLK